MIRVNLNYAALYIATSNPISLHNTCYQTLIGRGFPGLPSSAAHTLSRQFLRNNAINLPALSPELRDVLLGKAPLRLILSFREIPNLSHLRIETLACGHEYQALENWCWNDGHLEYLGYSAKRRRCVTCKELVANRVFEPVSPVPSAGRVPASKSQSPVRLDSALPPKKSVHSIGLTPKKKPGRAE